MTIIKVKLTMCMQDFRIKSKHQEKKDSGIENRNSIRYVSPESSRVRNFSFPLFLTSFDASQTLSSRRAIRAVYFIVWSRGVVPKWRNCGANEWMDEKREATGFPLPIENAVFLRSNGRVAFRIPSVLRVRETSGYIGTRLRGR